MDQPISPVRFTGLFFARTMHSTTEIRNDVSEQVCVCGSEIRKTFSPLGAAFSAGAAWSGARKDPRASPQPGAIPTTARAN